MNSAKSLIETKLEESLSSLKGDDSTAIAGRITSGASPILIGEAFAARLFEKLLEASRKGSNSSFDERAKAGSNLREFSEGFSRTIRDL